MGRGKLITAPFRRLGDHGHGIYPVKVDTLADPGPLPRGLGFVLSGGHRAKMFRGFQSMLQEFKRRLFGDVHCASVVYRAQSAPFVADMFFWSVVLTQ